MTTDPDDLARLTSVNEPSPIAQSILHKAELVNAPLLNKHEVEQHADAIRDWDKPEPTPAEVAGQKRGSRRTGKPAK